MKRLRSRWKLAKTVEEAEKDIMELDGQLRGKVKSADLQTVMSNQTSFVRLSAGASKNRKGGDLVVILLNKILLTNHVKTFLYSQPSREGWCPCSHS